jgi:hypothetical protein
MFDKSPRMVVMIDWLIVVGFATSRSRCTKALNNRPFVPHINLWEPCCFTKVPDSPQTYALNVLWLQEEGAQIRMSECEVKASHSQRMWAEVLSSAPYLLHSGLSDSPTRWKCLFRLLCPVERPVTALDCILLKDRSVALTPRRRPEINSRACLWVSPRSRHRVMVLLTTIPFFYILIPNFTMSLTSVFVNNGVKHKKIWGRVT